MSTRTISAPSRPALLHPHHENREQNNQQRNHDRQQRPQNQVIHQLLRLVLMLERNIITINHITVASKRITSLIPRARHQSALSLINAGLTRFPHISSSVTAAFIMRRVQHIASGLVFAREAVTSRVITVDTCIPNFAFTLVFILPNIGAYDQTKRAVFARSLFVLLALTYMRKFAVRAVAELVAHAFISALRVYALAVARAWRYELVSHLCALVDVLGAVDALPALAAAAFVERKRAV